MRQGAAGGRGQRPDPEKKVTRESRAIPAPDANAELVLSVQKRQASAKSCSEMFNNHREEVAYGFPFEPPRASQAAEQPCTNRQPLQHKRASHSGPLVNQSAWAKTGKNLDANLKASNGADSSTMTSSVASRRSLLNEDKWERTGSFHAAVPKLIAWFPGSFKEASESMARLEEVDHMQPFSNSHQNEGGSSSKDPVLHGYGSKGNKIHYSGPLIVPSGNTDQMMKDHDRHIQEAVRRARMDKARIRKMQGQLNQVPTSSLFVAGR